MTRPGSTNTHANRDTTLQIHMILWIDHFDRACLWWLPSHSPLSLSNLKVHSEYSSMKAYGLQSLTLDQVEALVLSPTGVVSRGLDYWLIGLASFLGHRFPGWHAALLYHFFIPSDPSVCVEGDETQRHLRIMLPISSWSFSGVY